jgi:hypothetical protein
MKIDIDQNNDLRLKEVYNGILMETSEGNRIGICMRDDTFEINICSDDDTQNWWRVNFKDGCIEKDCSNIEQEYIPEKKDNVVG